MADYIITNNHTGATTSLNAEEMEWITESVVQDKLRITTEGIWHSFSYKEGNVQTIIDKLRSISSRISEPER